MTLKEYFELEDQLREVEKRIEFSYGAMSDWNVVKHSEEFKERTLKTLRENKEQAEKLRQKLAKARLDLSED